MTIVDPSVRSVLTSSDGSVEIVRSDRDHVSVQVMPGCATHDVLAGSRVLCGAVTDQRARHARHVQTAVDGAEPSGGIYLEALRARIGIDVRSMTMRRAGSSVMVNLLLMPADQEPGAETPSTGSQVRSPVRTG